MSRRIDPVRTEVVARYLLAVTEEMSAALTRTAFSPNIKERMDCSTAVFDAGGSVVALPQRIPIHLGSMVGVVDAVLKKFPRETILPGDMFIANDPYNGGGSHLPDINMIAPVFYDGVIVAFVANIAHHADVGGMVPGSEAAICSSIYQEGLRIPPVRLVKDGTLDHDLLDMVLLNSRTPDERSGDLRAQIAANTVGIRAVQALFKKYGVAELSHIVEGYLDATERRFAATIRRLPAGVYEAVDWLDGNSPGERAAIQLKLTIEDGHLLFDFEGSSAQLDSARNIPYRALIATIYTVCKSMLDPDVAANAGYFRTIKINTPTGSVVGPVAPAAIGARAISCAVLGDVVAAALSASLPGRGLARSGPHQLIVLAGEDPRTNKYFVNYETMAGGMGARAYRNGMDAVRVHASGASNLPVETLEHSYPFLIERYEIARESGGRGQFNGGAGILRDYRLLADEAVLSVSSERQHVVAAGSAGGQDGGAGAFILDPGTPREQKLPASGADIKLKRGQVLRVCTPGGGGYGPPA